VCRFHKFRVQRPPFRYRGPAETAADPPLGKSWLPPPGSTATPVPNTRLAASYTNPTAVIVSGEGDITTAATTRGAAKVMPLHAIGWALTCLTASTTSFR